MFNVETSNEGVSGNTYSKDYIVRNMLWWKNKNPSTLYILGCHNFYLKYHSNMPCINMVNGNIKTIKELLSDGYVEAGVDNYECEKIVYKIKDNESYSVSDIIKSSIVPNTFIDVTAGTINLGGGSPVGIGNLVLAFKFTEYVDYIKNNMPDLYTAANVKNSNGFYDYMYHCWKTNGDDYIWDANICLLRTGISFIRFGDGTYEDNSTRIVDYTTSPYTYMRIKLAKATGDAIKICEYRKETFNGSSAG